MKLQKQLLKMLIQLSTSSDDSWRASIAVSDAANLKDLGHNVTLMLNIEGVQVGVNNAHNFLVLGNLINNVTDFINGG
jgi:predicted peroxiredoxin